MSEPVLKAIIKLFALVAKEDGVTIQEREQIKAFLVDRLSEQAVNDKLSLFDKYTRQVSDPATPSGRESEAILSICAAINKEIVQKQKIVVMAKLMSIILADGTISTRENELAHDIGSAFNISQEDIEHIKLFLSGRTPHQLNFKQILIVDHRKNTAMDYKHIYREDTDGFIAFLYIKSVRIFFFQHIGNTELLVNGITKKPENVSVLAMGSTLRWGNTPPLYYGDILAQFEESKSSQKLTLQANNLFYTFKNGNPGVRNVTIAETSGNLIAIMGGSGSGKSTLLSILNGMSKPTKGRVLINEFDIHEKSEKLKGIIGFVPQDDMLIEDLTVYQNLYFAARFCFSHFSKQEIKKLVSQTLEQLGLWEIKDLKVGSVLRKTISGGQRKRLNIGLELIREPAILFCDEPTSGLSSSDSENLLDLLKALSLKGKLIFTVIHQPSSSIFKMFDKLVILDKGGYQIYYDNPVDSVMYFKHSINSINSSQGECSTCGNINPEQIFNIIETRVIDEYGNFSNERKFSPEVWAKNYEKNQTVKPLVASTETPHTSLNIPKWLTQAKLFISRDVLSKISNTQYVLINLLEAPLLALILSSIVRFYNPEHPTYTDYLFSENLNIPSYFFMSVIVALFMGLTVSAEEIIRDSKVLKRESFLRLSRGSYLVSKITVLFSISAIQTLAFVLIGNYILDIEGMLFTHWIILFSTSCFSNMLGLNISSAFNSAVTIYILIPILLIPQLILSGAVVNFDKLNPVIGNPENVPIIGDLMTSRWAFEALMVTQFKNNDYEKIFYSTDQEIAHMGYKKKYYIPYLKAGLGQINDKFLYDSSDFNNKNKDLKSGFSLLRNEIAKELKEVKKVDFKDVDKLNIQQYDSTVYAKTLLFFDTLKKYYTKEYRLATQKKEDIIKSMTETASQKEAFEKLKISHQNRAVARLVKNEIDPQPIIRVENRLVQKIFPIYKDSNSNHLIDFGGPFYTPKKYFINLNIDTLVFNLLMIWVMGFMLFLTLYFNILRKIVEGLGSFSDLVPKRV